MSGKKDPNTPLSESGNIHIDYENFSVAEIMDQVKKEMASHPGNSEGEEAAKSHSTGATPQENLPESHKPGNFVETLSKPKRLLLKLMKPFAPLIKLLILPVHQELRETVFNLDNTNKRLDDLNVNLQKALDEVKENLNRFSSTSNQRLDLAHDDLSRAREYIKLLHNLSHNMVVEMTKLKIEQENLKIRIRILEKDFEHIKNREKALESRFVQ